MIEEKKRNLSGKLITLIGIIAFVVGYLLRLAGEFGVIFGGLLQVAGVIFFIIGLIRWNKELKDKKEHNH